MRDERVSDATRNGTWELLMDLERQVRYYLRLADRYSLWHRGLRFLLLTGIFLEGMAVYFLAAQEPELLRGVAGAGAALLGAGAIFEATSGFAEKAAGLRAVHLMQGDLKIEAERLWNDIETGRVQDAKAAERCSAIVDRWSKATRMTTVELHHHDNVKAAREAAEIVGARYAR